MIGDAVKTSISHFSKTWFEEGIKKLEKRWQKCIALDGDYVEK
jgi:hypothetical protein